MCHGRLALLRVSTVSTIAFLFLFFFFFFFFFFNIYPQIHHADKFKRFFFLTIFFFLFIRSFCDRIFFFFLVDTKIVLIIYICSLFSFLYILSVFPSVYLNFLQLPTPIIIFNTIYTETSFKAETPRKRERESTSFPRGWILIFLLLFFVFHFQFLF